MLETLKEDAASDAGAVARSSLSYFYLQTSIRSAISYWI